MHTATRLALPVIDRVRAINPAATLCAYGLYAPLNEALLRAARCVGRAGAGSGRRSGALIAHGFRHAVARQPLSRRAPHACRSLTFIQPDRAGLPALDRYASLQMPDGSQQDRRRDRCDARLQASLPSLPDRAGLRRPVPRRPGRRGAGRRAGAGGAGRRAHHVRRSGFLQRPDHARRIVEALHREFPAPDLRRDHQGGAPARPSRAAARARRAPDACSSRAPSSRWTTRCWRGWKGPHARRLHRGGGACRDAGLALVADLRGVHAVDDASTATSICWMWSTSWAGGARRAGAVGHPAARDVGLAAAGAGRHQSACVGPFDAKTLTYPVAHPDPRVDELQQQVMALAGVALDALARRRRRRRSASSLTSTLRTVSQGMPPPRPRPIPYLNEPWYC